MPRVVNIGDFKFGEEVFRLRYVVERDDVKFVAKDIAKALKYENTREAIRISVDEKYKSVFNQGEIQSPPTQNACETVAKRGDLLYLQPHTILLTKSGVIQLIMKSKLPYAVELQEWLLEEVIPQVLCTGKYEPAVGASNNGMIKINELTEKLAAANANLIEANKSLILFANEMIVARRDAETARKDCENARRDTEQARQDTAQLANRMADIAQDVITKPSDPRLLHSLAVCSMGGDQYAFLRPQARSLKRSLERLSVENKDIVFKSNYVPNAVNVLNKVKENLPKDKYTARHNKITLLEDLTKEDLVEAINSSLTQRQVAIIAKKANENCIN
ncbi:Baculovirus repeated ORF 1 [Trabala vishnou gigantina nucleopolyhedrovirus]|uniref:Baculovirus repeated ORF 1 n=1 Tax=Trabala vishnou gigantina nucleopolyhedrovirus TaxID=2863583 RepID=UPI002481A33C|nr:Baculovirus repeated ORF 1 [Trabala vishnou gigantina nucleopolyhedrovirus]QYC92701.1 Baculovirus repeated ORF 1 [Trabala vishnou gigantina nucleopolyhedrovirus]